MAEFRKEDIAALADVMKLRQAQSAWDSLNNSLTRAYKSGGLTLAQYDRMSGAVNNFSVTGVESADKLMKALDKTGGGFDVVGASIGRATMKVAFWLVATTAVIGAMRKAQDVVNLWRNVEVALERIGVTTSTVGENLYKFFDMTADVAIRMGMPIEQVLSGMDLALRATAQYEDQARRATTATTLLRDAAILGNVAGMQFSQAIDTLVGSLKQTGMELDQGIVLLDKWVEVAKNAQVSINDLSQGFAIMASAAESAGLSIDQVNGIIAAMSEVVTLGPIEVGNAVRSLMATLYNPGSIKILERYGIAVRDITGEYRSFWEIMTELASMTRTGALSSAQILEISKAAGEGQRRYAQFAALLKNWSRAVDMSTVSADAQGAALDANARIVDTLTNAWDQFTAAQNKFWYALGEKSGIIEDLTSIFKTLAGAFSHLANMSEPMARLIKLVAQLTVAFLAFKVAMSLVTRYNLAAWFATVGHQIKSLVGLGSVTHLLSELGLQKATIITSGALAGRIRAPVGGWENTLYPGVGKQAYAGGQLLPYPITTKGLGTGGAGAAGVMWSQVGKALIKPMGVSGGIFGGIAGKMIADTVYKDSDWAGWGGMIGGGIGAALGGPVGLVAGTFIGGAIAKVIEDTSKTFEEKVAEERERWLKDLPDAISSAFTRLEQELSVTLPSTVIPPLSEIIDEFVNQYDKEIEKSKAELAELEKRLESDVIGTWVMKGKYWTLPEYKEKFTSQIAKTSGLGVEIEQLKSSIPMLEELQKRAAGGATEITTLYDKAAEEADKIRTSLNLQVAAEKRIEDIKKESLSLTVDEREELISLAASAPLAYSNMLARLRMYLPDLAKEFEAAYPTFEDFIVVDPAAYGPLQEVLATILGTDQSIAEANKEIGNSVKWLNESLGGTETTYENINKQQQYWVDVLDAYQKGLLDIKPFYEIFGLAETEESTEKIITTIQTMIDDLGKGADATQTILSLQLQHNAALAMADDRYKHIAQYVQPGRLAFFDIDADMGRVQSIINRYTELFRGFIDSTDEVYHAFIKDEQGIIQGLYGTFKAQPEVWQAMLGELTGIESNTAKALEAEYNIPAWYSTPTRYWALKTTGTHEFGPAQKGLWELWMEFVSEQNKALTDSSFNFQETTDAIQDTTVALNAGVNAQTQYSSALNNGTQQLIDNIEQLHEVDWLIGPFSALTNLPPYLPLPSKQGGGAIPETGPYYLHKHEVVASATDFKDTNSILNNSYQVLMISQQYLSSINLGIVGLRQDIQQLRYDAIKKGVGAVDTQFGRTVRSGYAGVSSALGVRR